jgi:hypothetical protein
MLPGAFDDERNTVFSRPPQDKSPSDEDALIDPRCLGLGLNACERALLDCCPVVLHKATYSKIFALGVHGAGVTGCGLFDALEVADVLFRPAGRFDLAREAGAVFGLVAAIIIPVHDETGDIVDLAAWNPDDGALALWRGVAAMLGTENIFAPRLGEPLLVHETPLDWLRAGRRGVFIVDPQRAAPQLRLSEPLGVKREAHGRRLRQALAIPAPRIVVASNARAAA